jgi:hypothetical protein
MRDRGGGRLRREPGGGNGVIAAVLAGTAGI